MANNYGRGQSASDPDVDMTEGDFRKGSEVLGAHPVTAHHFGRGQVKADESVALPIEEIGENTAAPSKDGGEALDRIFG